MAKTYTQKVHFRIVIEGDYSMGNLLEEELCESAEETKELLWDYVADNICECSPIIVVDNLRTEVEKNG